MRFSDQIRREVRRANDEGLSRYRICKLIGVGQAAFSRFMEQGGGLAMDTLDDLAEVLGLAVEAKPGAVHRAIRRGAKEAARERAR